MSRIGDLSSGQLVRRERLESVSRWSFIVSGARTVPAGYVELGELCRVHRGQVTGANSFWIATGQAVGLPEDVLFPTVTRARELFNAGTSLVDASVLRRVIDLPEDIDRYAGEERLAIDRLIRRAQSDGVHRGYVARQRKAWWRVGLHAPAPILATYMARRPPSFVRNVARVRHINIAHGLYPREPFTGALLEGLVRFLNNNVSLADGRAYAGGLVKFEPREMERLLVPTPDILMSM